MAAPPPSRREDFTVAVVCALPLEYDAAELAFDELWDESELGLGKAEGDTNHYVFGRIGKHNAVLLRCGMGKVNAASATASLRSSYCGIKLALLCGICGGVPPSGNAEMLLGDVIISENVVQYDLGRQYPSDFESKDTMQDSLGRPLREVRSLVDAYKTRSRRLDLQRQIDTNLAQLQDKAVKAGYEVEYTRPQHADVLFRPDYVHRHRKQVNCDCSESRACGQATRATCDELGCDINCSVPRRRCETLADSRPGRDKGNAEPLRPFAFIGSVGSGDTVMKSGAHRDGIARRYNLVAFEMEGAGVWDEIPCVVVKGVCDYADSHKNKGWQHYAAATAAAASKALLDRYVSRSAPIEQATEVEMPSFSPKFLVPYVKNPDFVGREDILGRITHLFGAAQNGHVTATTKRRSRVALHGLGGVGKTQIALAYAYWLHETFPKVSVFWVHASNHQRFRQAFASIAQECGIPNYDDQKPDTLLLVKKWLESKKSGPWLLIIDNADDKEIFFKDHGTGTTQLASEGELGHYIPECRHGSVLVTTRDKKTGMRIAPGPDIIEVNQMNGPEAAQLLQSLLPNNDFSPPEAIALASRLEYLPLAMAQAASFILENSMSITEYVQLLDRSDSSLVHQLSEPFASVGRDSETPHALTATWLISFRQIEEQHPLAGNLLSFMSMFDRQAIPKQIAHDYCQEHLHMEFSQTGSGVGFDCNYGLDTAAVSDALSEAGSDTTMEATKALGVLQAFSFVSKSSNGNYDMHRLVHLVTRKRLLQDNNMAQFAREALSLMSRTFPYGSFENRVVCLAYLPHALAILARSNPQSDEAKIQTGKLLHNVAGYFDYQGQDSEAEKHLAQALELQKAALGHEHPRTLETVGNLAMSHIYQNRLEVAIEMLLSTLKAQRRLLGESDTNVLYTRRRLARAYKEQDRLEEAEKLYLETLEICKRAGQEPEQMAGVFGELSVVYFKQGRYEEAEKLQLQVLESDRKFLPEGPETTLWTMNRLGNTYQKQGRLSEAVDMYSQTLDRSRTLMGEEHIMTIDLMWRLGLLYEEQGHLEMAEELVSKVLDIRRSSRGEEYEGTLWAKAGLGRLYKKQGRLEEAGELLLEVLNIQRSTKGEEHEDTTTVKKELGLVYKRQGRLEEAQELLLEVLNIQRSTKGEEHEDTTSVKEDLGYIYKRQGRLEEAEKLFLKVLDIRKSTKGDEHEDTISASADLGRVYRKQGRLDEAEELLLKVLDLWKSTKGDEHEDTIWAIADLGRVYQNQSRLEEAEGLWLKAFETWKTTKGEEHQDTAQIMGDLGLLYACQNRLVKAEELQQRALKVRRKVSGEKHTETLTQENNLAWTWWGQGRKEEAIQLMRKCAKARECTLGRDCEYTNISLKVLSRWEKEMEAEDNSEGELESASEDSSGDGEDAFVGSDDESDDGEGARL